MDFTGCGMYHPETDRLNFLINRGGIGEAMEFAERTMKIYRRVVLSKDRSKEDRRTFVQSYLAFKHFLRNHR
jgi:hypothetical protein